MRELREELGVETEPVERIPGEWPLKPPYVLQVWTARIHSGSGDPKPLQDHDELRWLAPGEIWDVPWLDQDVPAGPRGGDAAGCRAALIPYEGRDRRCAGSRMLSVTRAAPGSSTGWTRACGGAG